MQCGFAWRFLQIMKGALGPSYKGKIMQKMLGSQNPYVRDKFWKTTLLFFLSEGGLYKASAIECKEALFCLVTDPREQIRVQSASAGHAR